MTPKKKFTFTTSTVVLDDKTVHFQVQCRSGGGGNGRCGGKKTK